MYETNFNDLKTIFLGFNDIGKAKDSSDRTFLSINQKYFTEEPTVIQVDDSTNEEVVLTLDDIITDKMEDKHMTKYPIILNKQTESSTFINQHVPKKTALDRNTTESVEKPYMYYSASSYSGKIHLSVHYCYF